MISKGAFQREQAEERGRTPERAESRNEQMKSCLGLQECTRCEAKSANKGSCVRGLEMLCGCCMWLC